MQTHKLLSLGARCYKILGRCSVSDGVYKANGTITLVTGPKNILVDTGSPCSRDRALITEGLMKEGLTPEDINFVVGTHGHVDHIGNINLFPRATIAVGFDIYDDGRYLDNSLSKGGAYKLDDLVDLIPTPGHTCHDISLVVRETRQGTVVVAGDLFENENDIADPGIWKENSHNTEVQQLNRLKVLRFADCIIPGHGCSFIVKPEYRNSENTSPS